MQACHDLRSTGHHLHGAGPLMRSVGRVLTSVRPVMLSPSHVTTSLQRRDQYRHVSDLPSQLIAFRRMKAGRIAA